MQTIKTGIVVALLLAVCYGAFVALNAPEPDLPPSIDEWIAGEQEFQDLVGFESDTEMASLESAVPLTPDEFLNQMEGNAGSQTAAELPTMGSTNNLASGGDAGFPALPGETDAPSLGVDMPDLSPNLTPGNDIAASANSLAGNMPSSPGLENEEPPLTGFPALDSGNLAAGNTEAPSLSMPSPGTTSPDGSMAGNSASPWPNLPLGSNSEPSTSATENSSSLIPPMLDTGEAAGMQGYEPEPMQQAAALASTYDKSTTPPESGLSLPAADFATARSQALQLTESGELSQALRMLTPYFGSPELRYEESTDLIDILDGLAKEVIYSNRSLLEPAYFVKEVDTVESIANAHGLSPEFLAAINGLGSTRALVAGSTLKVLKGPFNAKVDLGRSEMTLYLGGLYAGRFPISTGNEPAPKAGMFEVVDRQTKRTYYGASSNVLKHSDPRNPYGGYWIDLGEGLCIHGSAEMFSEDLANAGCISLAPIDARDIYNILVNGSQVEIAGK